MLLEYIEIVLKGRYCIHNGNLNKALALSGGSEKQDCEIQNYEQ